MEYLAWAIITPVVLVGVILLVKLNALLMLGVEEEIRENEAECKKEKEAVEDE